MPCTVVGISFPLFISFFLPLLDKGVAKIARKLGFDYAEAVVSPIQRISVLQTRKKVGDHTTVIYYYLQTGFEFKKRRAFPIVEGVVIAADNEPILLEVRKCIEYYSGVTNTFFFLPLGVLGS